MSNLNISLLRAAQKEFADIILPELKGSDRYTGAMLNRALSVLSIEAVTASHPDTRLKPCGFDTANDLALALRTRRALNETALTQCLRSFVRAKLQISNPKYLEISNHSHEGIQT